MGFFDFIDSIWELLGSVALRQWGSLIALLCIGGIVSAFLALILWPFSKFLEILGVASQQLVQTIGKVLIAVVVVGSIVAIIWAWKNQDSAASMLAEQAPLLEQPISTSVELSPTSVAVEQPAIPLPNSICWTYELRDFSGARWRVWEMIVKANVGDVMDWTQFKTDVVAYNQILIKDEYEFFTDKTYLLPEKCP